MLEPAGSQATIELLGRPAAADRTVLRAPALPWRLVLAAALLSLLLGAALWQGLPGGRSSTLGAARSGGISREDVSSLPLAAQGPVSRALGAADPAYRIGAFRGGFQAVSAPQRLRARFGRSGVQVASGATRLGLSLRALGYGTSLAALGAVAPRASGNRVTYARGGLSEWYANGPLGLEQGFTVSRAPAGLVAGPLTLSMALSSDAHASLAAGGQSIALARAGEPSLRYGGLVATDARGRALHSWFALQGGRVLLRVDARGAVYPVRIDPFLQQGEKLTGEGSESGFGMSVALSDDGNTALIGNSGANVALSGDGNTALIGVVGDKGTAWAFTRSGATWTQQGPKLTLGGEQLRVGAVWVFARSGSTWTQQGEKLTGAGESGEGFFGTSLALSEDGDTALIGGYKDNGNVGAAWVFARSGSTWTQQGEKLTGAGESGEGRFGISVALSGDGATALIGGRSDKKNIGAAWVFARSGSTWTQQGEKLTGAGESPGGSEFGYSVALSGDGGTALIGGPNDDTAVGAAWVFARSGSTWTQQGSKLTGAGESGRGEFGYSVALSGDGGTALVGGRGDNEFVGAAWVFARSGSTWAQQGEKLTGAEESGEGRFGTGVALSGDGATALIGGEDDNAEAGAAWVFASAGKCTDSWTNTAGGSWFTAGDWSRGTPPGPEDTACITASGTYTVTMTQTSVTGPVRVGSLTVGGASGQQTLAIGACSPEDDATLTATTGIGNGTDGAITLTGVPPGAGEACGAPGTVTLNGPLDNEGAITVEPVSNGAVRQLRGGLTNTGTLAIDANTAYDDSGALLRNEGAIDVAEASRLMLSNASSLSNNLGGSIAGTGSGDVLASGATFDEGAGSTSGAKPVIVDDGTLEYTGTTSEHGSGPIALRGTSSLSGDVRSGETLSIESTCSESARANAAGAFYNAGPIVLTSAEGCPGNVTLNLQGATLTTYGTLEVENPQEGTRTIEGGLENSGGWVKLDEGATLHVGGGFTQTATGTLATAIAGASDYGSLSVAGKATLAGSLVVRQPPPFKGSLGETFAILTGGSLAGAFASETGAQIDFTGLYYKPVYAAKKTTLRVARAALSLSAKSGPPGSAVTLSGKGYLPGDTITPTFTDHKGAETVLPSTTANAGGEISTEIAIPAAAALGEGSIAVTSTQTGVHVSRTFTVT